MSARTHRCTGTFGLGGGGGLEGPDLLAQKNYAMLKRIRVEIER